MSGASDQFPAVFESNLSDSRSLSRVPGLDLEPRYAVRNSYDTVSVPSGVT